MLDGINFDITRCVLPFVALLIGWAIGFFDSNLRTSKKIKAAETNAEVAIKEAKDKADAAEAQLSIMTAVTPEDNSLLRLGRDGENVTLHLDGQKVPTPNLSADQRKRLIGLITVMRPWLEGDAAQQAVARTVTTAPQSAPVIPAPPILTPSIMTSAMAEPEKPARPATSIVEQIDVILQRRMLNTPLAKMDIRLQESHEGGVEVMVGVKRYEVVDEVPDPQIRSAIRAAIDEWEKKYTPGL